MELLSKTDEESQNLKGKSIIGVYGDTGVGKSSFTNYLIRVPMKKVRNEEGEWRV